MGSKEQDEIIKKQIAKKIEKLARLEEKQTFHGTDDIEGQFQISRKIFACFDGFIILRAFSKTHLEPFQLTISPLRVAVFGKNFLPIKTTDGLELSLYKLINPAIRLGWGVGTKLDIGSRGGGLQINQFRVDGFQLLILSYQDIEQFKETIEDIDFIVYSNTEMQRLANENNELIATIERLNLVTKPLILTEGKTDWKHFVAALRVFHSRDQYLDIQEEWFLRFGSEADIINKVCDTSFQFENNVAKLNSLLESYIESRKIDSGKNSALRIGIFDSDDKQAKAINDKEANVFSIIIEPNGISVELLYSEEELKHSVEGKRLYLGSEFESRSKKYTNDPSINLGGDNSILNKAGKRVIIDSDVYDAQGSNIALSKERFARQVYEGGIRISEESLSNFGRVFSKVSELVRR